MNHSTNSKPDGLNFSQFTKTYQDKSTLAFLIDTNYRTYLLSGLGDGY